MEFKLTTLHEISHGCLRVIEHKTCINHQTVFCKPIQRDYKVFYFCVDNNILMKYDDIFFINPGSCTVELLNSILSSDGDCCYVLDKSLIVTV